MTDMLFDSQRFLQSLADDHELAMELLVAFVEDSSERSLSLKQALESGDSCTAMKLAHSLKGMCGVVRASALVDLSFLMEDAAKKGDLDKVREQYGIFAGVLEKALGEMRQFMNAE
ncbi:MAG: Hpt domain-containing protein [Pseudodesulfovibrio sp.]|nr:Hpt domain-containing protein [Pseudodesulfovibrio sp.]